MTSTEDLNQRIELLKCLLGLLDASLAGVEGGGVDGVDPWARILGNRA